MVFRRCRRLLGDEEAALDATQDVFVQVVRHATRLDDSAPSSLLYRVATRVCLNRIRSGRRQRTNLPTAGDPETALLSAIADLPDPGERVHARGLLDRLFSREPDSSRLIAVLHLIDGLTLEETAAEVGLSVSGVRKRLRTLRERLGAIAPEPTSAGLRAETGQTGMNDPKEDR